VANTPSQLGALPGIVARAAANGADDLVQIDARAAMALEPALQCLGAVLSPSTGIVDSHALMLSLQGDLEHAGGMVALHSGVRSLRRERDGWLVEASDGTGLLAQVVVNAAGLQACALASRIEALPAQRVPRPYFAKGNYFT